MFKTLFTLFGSIKETKIIRDRLLKVEDHPDSYEIFFKFFYNHQFLAFSGNTEFCSENFCAENY